MREICDTIASCTTPIIRLCELHDYWPDRYTLYLWARENSEFGGRLEEARRARADLLFDEALGIADDPRYDWQERYNQKGEATVSVDHEHIQRSTLRVNVRKWQAGKLAPRKYGDRVAVEGVEDGAPITFSDLVKKAVEGKRR